MVGQFKTKRQEGFTIIEVLIVLAIAGLIMLIVFLAVPALQRSSRNNGRKTDSSRIAAAASNFVSNSNGAVPSTAANMTSILTDAGTMAQYTALVGAAGAMAGGKLSVTSGAIGAVPVITVVSGDAVEIDTGATCVAATPGTTAVAGSSRQMAMLYTQEPGSGANFTISCLDI